MPFKQLFLSLSAGALLALSACGGGGDAAIAPTTKTASVTMQTYITDNLAVEYSKVWVSIKKISAVDGTGAEVTLFDAGAQPVVVNLSSLAAVGQFMSTVTIPAGIYTQVNVTMVNEVQLVSLDGATTISAKFDATGSDYVWKVKSVEVDASKSGQIVLDFNLSKFTYDAVRGIVTPHLDVPKPTDAFKKFERQQAEIKGPVVSVDTAGNRLTMNDRHLGNGVIVSLAADAVIIDEESHKTMSLAEIAVGARIEVKGTVTPGATPADPVSVLATLVHVESEKADAAPKAKGEGTVVSVKGMLVTVKLTEANFLPGSDTVVVDVSNAKFTHGQLADLAADVEVEFKGTISGTGPEAKVLAKVFEIEGASSEKERNEHPERKFTLLKGKITLVRGDGSFDMLVTKPDRPFLAAGSYGVDPSQAKYAAGKPSCLLVGAEVNALGALTDKTLLAKIIEIKGCGGQERSKG